MKRCHRCHSEILIDGEPGRREACPTCGADLHCCLNCRFYSPDAYNQCRETQAERVLEKDRSNFCGFFVFGDSRQDSPTVIPGQTAKKRLEDLFKK
jgi:rRNA maturation protein Nop10